MFNRTAFYNAIRQTGLFPRGLSQPAVDGMNAILDEWETGAYGNDLLHLAYALATTYHETDGTMSPIEEYGKGAGKPYGDEYGRGFAQITWLSNYAKFGRLLNIPLATNYNLALVPQNAAKILLLGMTDGLFRKHKLANFDLTTEQGVYDARNIINGDKTYTDSKTRKAGVPNRGLLVHGYFAVFRDALLPAQAVTVGEPAFDTHPKNDMHTDDGDLYDNLPPLPQEYYDWLAEKRKQRQAEAYKELNQKPLVRSSVAGFVAAGFVSALIAAVSQHFGIEVPPEAKDWLYGAIIAVMGSGALWGRAKATTIISGLFSTKTSFR